MTISRKKNLLSGDSDCTLEQKIMLAGQNFGQSPGDITGDNIEGGTHVVGVGKDTYAHQTTKESRRRSKENTFEKNKKQTEQFSQNQFEAGAKRKQAEADRGNGVVPEKDRQEVADQVTASTVESRGGKSYKGKNDGSGQYTRNRSDGKKTKETLNVGKQVGEETRNATNASKKQQVETGFRYDKDGNVDKSTRSAGDKTGVYIAGKPKPGGGTGHTHPSSTGKFENSNGK